MQNDPFQHVTVGYNTNGLLLLMHSMLQKVKLILTTFYAAEVTTNYTVDVQ